MINRRHIRVKVMQSVYALTTSNSDNIVKEENFLNNSIEKNVRFVCFDVGYFTTN